MRSKRLIGFLFPFGFLFSCATNPPRPQSEGSYFVLKICDALEQYYYDPAALDNLKLFNAALVGAAESLGEKGIPYKPPNVKSRVEFSAEFKKIEDLASESKKFKEHELSFAAGIALLESLDNSHTYFISPEIYQEEQKRESGASSYSGIGAFIKQLEENFFYIGRVFPNSPAEKAGLKRFDRIIEVDGKEPGKNVKEIVSKVRGKKDTVVELKIERGGAPINFKITRGDILEPFVQGEILKADELSIVYLLIYSFDILTLIELAALDDKLSIFSSKVDGIIVDVRGNPGGFMVVLDSLLELFLKNDTPTYILKGRGGQNKHFTKSPPATKAPLVILINEDSASAAEIFAAVLQENGRAEVVGAKSGGQVSVGMEIPLPYEAAILVTINEIFTAKNKKLEKVGVAPNAVVEFTRDDIVQAKDRQLEKALKVLKEKAGKNK